MLGPSRGPPPSSSAPVFIDGDTDSPPKSPRTLLRDLTLPTVPNLDIPSSPPGSPPPHLEALTAKFTHLLKLKRDKGVHFNARLASSDALRNPALMDKLLGFAGVETEPEGGREQYATVLGADDAENGQGEGGARGIWDPAAFPGWAFRGELRRAQERATRERERARGERVEFVKPVERGATPGVGDGGLPPLAPPPVTGKRKSRFDVM
jgi:hypothetical protein